MAGGRPPKLTPDVQQRLCDAIAAGATRFAACGHASIGYRTFLTWMKLGKQAKARKEFRQFRQSIQDAEARAELRVTTLVSQEIPGDWRAGLAFLARRFPKRWGNRDHMEVRHKGKVAVSHDFDLEDRIGADPEASRLACELLQRLTTGGASDTGGTGASGESQALAEPAASDQA